MPQDLSRARLTAARRTVGVKLPGAARRLARRAVLALSSWVSAEHNPFFLRALRLEARKNRPWFTVAGAAGALLAAVAAGCFLRSQWPEWQTTWEHDSVARALGRNFVGFVGIMAAAICAYTALFAALARASHLLRQERLLNTLDQLRLLPLAEERWLWMMSAHPTALALLIGLAGLPVFCLAAATNQWSALDVPGLFIVLLWVGNAAPSWTQQPAEHGAAAKRRSDTDASGDEPQVLDKAAETPAPPSGSETIARTEAAPFATSSAFEWGWLIFGLLVWQAILWMFFNMRSSTVPPWMMGSAWHRVLRALPAPYDDLLPAFPVTWPLLLAHFLVTPLPFFSILLPPLLLLAPYCVARRMNWYIMLALSVAAPSEFRRQRRLVQRAKLNKVAGWCCYLMVAGFGWRAFISGGLLSALLPGAPATADWALAAWWTLVLAGTTLTAARDMQAFLNPEAYAQEGAARAWHAALWGAARALGFGLCVYAGACWMGGQWGVSAAWWERMGPTLATAAAFLLAVFGAFTLEAALPSDLRPWCANARRLWFYGLLIEAALRVVREWIVTEGAADFAFEQAPHVMLSPFVSLLALFRFDLSPSGAPEWWRGPLIQCLVGMTCAVQAAALAFSRLPGGDEAPETGARWWFVLLALLRAVVWSVLGALGWLIVMAFRALGWLLSPLFLFVRQILATGSFYLEHSTEAILRWGQSLDNAVLTGELRRDVRRKAWPAQWLTLWVLEAILFLSMAQPWTLLFMPWQEGRLMTPPVNAAWQAWGETVIGAVLGGAWLLAGLAVLPLGRAFDRDRTNGALVFLFLTPMTEADIVGGKLLAGLTYALGALATAVPWLLMGCLVAVTGGSFALPIICVCGVAVVLATLIFAACLQMLFAVRAVKPVEGMAKAMFCGAGAEIIIWILPGLLGDDGSFQLGGALLFVAFLHLALAFGCWRLALASLARQRYSERAVRGTLAN